MGANPSCRREVLGRSWKCSVVKRVRKRIKDNAPQSPLQRGEAKGKYNSVQNVPTSKRM